MSKDSLLASQSASLNHLLFFFRYFYSSFTEVCDFCMLLFYYTTIFIYLNCVFLFMKFTYSYHLYHAENRHFEIEFNLNHEQDRIEFSVFDKQTQQFLFHQYLTRIQYLDLKEICDQFTIARFLKEIC